MGVGAQSVTLQLLTRGERERAVDLEGVALSADHDVGAAAFAINVFANACGEFVRDPLTQGLSDIDMFAGDLDLHRTMNAPAPGWCQDFRHRR